MTPEKKRPDHPIENHYGFEFDDTTPLSVPDGLHAHSQTGSFGQSWWAERWIKALTQTVPASRLVRGKEYARHGQVVDIAVQVGLVVARVQGTQPSPYRIRITIKTFENADWERAIEAMASQAIYSAQLLNGEMPHDIEEAFRSVGVALFPESRGDLVTQCTCPDWATPCKHVTAVCLLLGELLDEDPFWLFVMRGRTKEQIMAALRAKRADHASLPTAEVTKEQPVLAGRSADATLEQSLRSFWQMGPQVENIQIHVVRPEVEMEVIKVLGNPAFTEDEALAARLAEVYLTVSAKAREVAYSED